MYAAPHRGLAHDAGGVGPAARWLDRRADLDRVEPGQVPARQGLGDRRHGADGAAGGHRRRGPPPARRSCSQVLAIGTGAVVAGAHRAGAPSRRRIPDARGGCWLLVAGARGRRGAAALAPVAPPAAPARRARRPRRAARRRRPASSSASWRTSSPGWATEWRSGCSRAGCCPTAGLGLRARHRGVHRVVSRGLPGAVRARRARACAKACSFSCCRARSASARRRRWRSPRGCC